MKARSCQTYFLVKVNPPKACLILLVLAYLMQAHSVLDAVRPVFGGKVQ